MSTIRSDINSIHIEIRKSREDAALHAAQHREDAALHAAQHREDAALHAALHREDAALHAAKHDAMMVQQREYMKDLKVTQGWVW